MEEHLGVYQSDQRSYVRVLRREKDPDFNGLRVEGALILCLDKSYFGANPNSPNIDPLGTLYDLPICRGIFLDFFELIDYSDFDFGRKRRPILHIIEQVTQVIKLELFIVNLL
jgi:hypothetical protein